MKTEAPQKVAILGGGISAVTAAFYLTSQPDWQSRYDITLYQLGWRLGGKGASGRNAAMGERIEEHGLHIWFGFYANAFQAIQDCYAALNRPPGAPLATWDEALKPHDFVVLQEWINQHWISWPIVFPEVPGNPAHGSETFNLAEVLEKLWAWIHQFLGALQADMATHQVKPHLHGMTDTTEHHHFAALATLLKTDEQALMQRFHNDIGEALEITRDAVGQYKTLPKTGRAAQHAGMSLLWRALKRWLEARFAHLLDTHTDIRRLFIMADLGLTIGIGMLEDGVLTNGFDVINDIDFKDWLRKHGANEQYSVQSAPVRGFYDLVFAFIDGDVDQPNIEAGTMLRGILSIALLYKGGVMWKMQAGMGDTIFGPMYEVLVKRGVKFEYFHEVMELVPQGNEIGEIVVQQQVALAPGLNTYEPLVGVKGLPCWPSEPLYDQIDPAQAALLQQHNINLESFWSPWPAVYAQHFGAPLPQKRLQKGIDFDLVIFGISVGSIPYLCPQLLAQDSVLRTMTERVKTVVTQAYQIWTDTTLHDMGWTDLPNGQEPVMSAFTEPYDTWAPMDQLLCREDWPPNLEPKNVSYFCSVQPVASFPPRTDYEFPSKMKAIAKAGAKAQLKNDIWNLLPEVATEGTFEWSILIDPDDRQGDARFDAQYWRSNIDPSERYVLSVVNSSAVRLETDGTQFTNLYLTGDWIKTGLNASCVEAATMAGMQTSRAISGWPKIIKGETAG